MRMGMARRKSSRPGEKLNITGIRIRQMREKAGLQAKELAAKLQREGWDIDPVVLSNIENQSRSVTDIELAMILRVLKRKWADFDKAE